MCSLTGLLVLVLLGAVSAKTCAQNSDCDVTFERCCSGVCTNQVADPQGGTSCSPACTCDQICCNAKMWPKLSRRIQVLPAPAGQAIRDLCKDLQNDYNNCGTCGHACPSGSTCYKGACIAADCNGAVACPKGLTCCPAGANGAGFCYNLLTATHTCGSCTNSCNGGWSVCCNGQCKILSPPGNDAKNCGGCGVTCAAGLVCKNNFCVPPPPPPNPPPGDGEPEYSVTTDYPPYYPPAYVDPAAVFEG